jgi:hypothetical protein
VVIQHEIPFASQPRIEEAHRYESFEWAFKICKKKLS